MQVKCIWWALPNCPGHSSVTSLGYWRRRDLAWACKTPQGSGRHRFLGQISSLTESLQVPDLILHMEQLKEGNDLHQLHHTTGKYSNLLLRRFHLKLQTLPGLSVPPSQVEKTPGSGYQISAWIVLRGWRILEICPDLRLEFQCLFTWHLFPVVWAKQETENSWWKALRNPSITDCNENITSHHLFFLQFVQLTHPLVLLPT